MREKEREIEKYSNNYSSIIKNIGYWAANRTWVNSLFAPVQRPAHKLTQDVGRRRLRAGEIMGSRLAIDEGSV